jgi:hypothetical protein
VYWVAAPTSGTRRVTTAPLATTPTTAPAIVESLARRVNNRSDAFTTITLSIGGPLSSTSTAPSSVCGVVRRTGTNHGPGPVNIEMISGQVTPVWKRLLRRPQHFVILQDHTNPLNPKLPHRLEVGDTINLFLPYNEDCFLKDPATQIGVSDSFGRLHYAPSVQLREARERFRKDFPRRR